MSEENENKKSKSGFVGSVAGLTFFVGMAVGFQMPRNYNPENFKLEYVNKDSLQEL